MRLNKKKLENKKLYSIETQTVESKISQIKPIISNEIKMSALQKSIKINYIFFIGLIGCIYVLSRDKTSNKSLFITTISFLFASIIGYLFHAESHRMVPAQELYNNSDSLVKKNKILNWIAIKICKFIDFHPIIHHNTNINKQWKNILYEFINNLFTQGILMVIAIKLLNYLDLRVIILWAFLYATVHNINFFYINPTTHRDHHIDDTTNFGLDTYDIIFDTKYNWDDIENFNHGTINLIILTVIVLYFSK